MKKIQTYSSLLHGQRGSAVIEFLVSALPILLLGLGATETTRWYIHKQHIRFALDEAQRVATVTHAEPKQFTEAFEEAIKPLFAPAGLYASTAARRDAYLSSVSEKTAMPPWRISITSPNSTHFHDFKQNDLVIAQSSGFAAINNNYQLEQHQEKPLGLHSQETIYEANILSVKLIYPYKPIVPGVAALMKQLSDSSNSKLKQAYYSNGYLPFELSAHMAMQSHPVLWPNDPSSNVVYEEQIITSDSSLSSSSTPSAGDDPCAGLWCTDTSSQRASGASNADLGSSSNGESPDFGTYQPPQSTTPAHNDFDTNPTNTWAPEGSANNNLTDDPLCGTSLCCT